MSNYGKSLGDGLITLFQNRGLVSSLSLAYCGWGARRSQEPVYPNNPYTDCPRLDLYMDSEFPEPWPSGLAKVTASYTVWYKRRHLIGVSENHQTALDLDVESIIEIFQPAGWLPVEIATVAPKVYGVYLNRPVQYHEDLHHEFDDPAMRVSVAEIPLMIEIRR